MNRKAVTLLVLIFTLIIVFSCSSLGSRDEPTEDDVSIDISAGNSGPVLSNDWKYETEITHKGSRSEGSISRLFYRYNEIPGVFTLVLIDQTLFEYKAMKNIWDIYGYIPSSAVTVAAFSETDLISSAELKRGWYESSDGLLKKATPQEWIFTETAEIGLWVSPEKINDMISIYDFGSIREELMPAAVNESH